jgi:hypothetical protein
MSQGRRVSFVVRVVQDSQGQVSGVVERVATGAKEAFTGKGAIGRVIARMLRCESTVPRAGSDTPASGDDKAEAP